MAASASQSLASLLAIAKESARTTLDWKQRAYIATQQAHREHFRLFKPKESTVRVARLSHNGQPILRARPNPNNGKLELVVLRSGGANPNATGLSAEILQVDTLAGVRVLSDNVDHAKTKPFAFIIGTSDPTAETPTALPDPTYFLETPGTNITYYGFSVRRNMLEFFDILEWPGDVYAQVNRSPDPNPDEDALVLMARRGSPAIDDDYEQSSLLNLLASFEGYATAAGATTMPKMKENHSLAVINSRKALLMFLGATESADRTTILKAYLASLTPLDAKRRIEPIPTVVPPVVNTKTGSRPELQPPSPATQRDAELLEAQRQAEAERLAREAERPTPAPVPSGPSAVENTLRADIATLRANLDTLTKEKTALQTRLADAEAQSTSLRAENLAATTFRGKATTNAGLTAKATREEVLGQIALGTEVIAALRAFFLKHGLTFDAKNIGATLDAKLETATIARAETAAVLGRVGRALGLGASATEETILKKIEAAMAALTTLDTISGEMRILLVNQGGKDLGAVAGNLRELARILGSRTAPTTSPPRLAPAPTFSPVSDLGAVKTVLDAAVTEGDFLSNDASGAWKDAHGPHAFIAVADRDRIQVTFRGDELSVFTITMPQTRTLVWADAAGGSGVRREMYVDQFGISAMLRRTVPAGVEISFNGKTIPLAEPFTIHNAGTVQVRTPYKQLVAGYHLPSITDTTKGVVKITLHDSNVVLGLYFTEGKVSALKVVWFPS